MADGGAPRIVILGGGIAGLSAAFRLKELSAKHDAPLEVTLMERGPRLGGALCTVREQGFIAEAGAAASRSHRSRLVRAYWTAIASRVSVRLRPAWMGWR